MSLDKANFFEELLFSTSVTIQEEEERIWNEANKNQTLPHLSKTLEKRKRQLLKKVFRVRENM